MKKKHKRVRMVIMRSPEGDPLTCGYTDRDTFINMRYAVEKVFYAVTHNEASQRFYDYEGFGTYKPFFPDTYLDDDSEVRTDK